MVSLELDEPLDRPKPRLTIDYPMIVRAQQDSIRVGVARDRIQWRLASRAGLFADDVSLVADDRFAYVSLTLATEVRCCTSRSGEPTCPTAACGQDLSLPNGVSEARTVVGVTLVIHGRRSSTICAHPRRPAAINRW